MHIRITFTLDHHDRRAIAQSMGEQRPASYAMCRKALDAWALDALETVVDDDEHGEYVEGDGDIFAAYVAKTLIENYAPDPDCGDGGIIAHLTALLDQAIADLTLVCEALETDDGAP